MSYICNVFRLPGCRGDSRQVHAPSTRSQWGTVLRSCYAPNKGGGQHFNGFDIKLNRLFTGTQGRGVTGGDSKGG